MATGADKTDAAPALPAPPSPWKRRLVVALLWLACALLTLGWFLGARPAANNREVYVDSTIKSLDLVQIDQKRTALAEAFRQYRQATDFGEFLLACALLTAIGAAITAPIWSAVEARRTRASEGSAGGGGGAA